MPFFFCGPSPRIRAGAERALRLESALRRRGLRPAKQKGHIPLTGMLLAALCWLPCGAGGAVGAALWGAAVEVAFGISPGNEVERLMRYSNEIYLTCAQIYVDLSKRERSQTEEKRARIMALIRGAYGGGTIKGSVSGNTYQGGAYGTVIRNRTKPVNPNTAGQASIRLAMREASFAWGGALDAGQRSAWAAYAAGTPLPDKFGTSQVTSGRQMFMRTNVIRLAAGLAFISDAPPTPGIAAPNPPTLVLDASTGINLTALAITLAVGDAYQISLSIPLNDTINYFKGPFITGATLVSTDTLPVLLKAAGPGLAVGQRYFCRYRYFQADGKCSNRVYLNLGEVSA